MKLIVHTADYGMSDCITDGCLHAIRSGILNDVGLMTNNSCSQRAVDEIKKYPHVSMGQEINLVFGNPVTNPELIPSLVNEEGRFMTSRERLAQYPDDENLGLVWEEVLLETENQVKKYIEMVGKKPLYLGGHSISTPYITKAREQVAEKYGINLDWKDYLNQGVRNRWYKNFSRTKSGFTPDLQAATDVEGYIIEDKGDLLNHDYSLLSTHCGFFDADLMKLSTFHIIRGVECSALVSPKVKQWIKENKIELINVEQFFKEKGIEY